MADHPPVPMPLPNPHPPHRSRVTRPSIQRAVDALLTWILSTAHQRTSTSLLPGNDLIFLVLTLTKIAHRGRTNAFRIPLPYSPSASICLLLDHRPTSPLIPTKARELILSHRLPVSEVVSVSDLRSDVDACRHLADSHDLFLADNRILPLLQGLLGKHFKKKTPVPINLSRESWPDQVRQCCESTLLYLRSGTCSVIKVARASQAREEIVDNVVAAIEGAVENVPRKWKNVRSFHIKAVDSLALPIYQALPGDGFKFEGLVEKEAGKGKEEEGSRKRKNKLKKLEIQEAKGTKRSRLI